MQGNIQLIVIPLGCPKPNIYSNIIWCIMIKSLQPSGWNRSYNFNSSPQPHYSSSVLKYGNWLRKSKSISRLDVRNAARTSSAEWKGEADAVAIVRSLAFLHMRNGHWGNVTWYGIETGSMLLLMWMLQRSFNTGPWIWIHLRDVQLKFFVLSNCPSWDRFLKILNSFSNEFKEPMENIIMRR